MKLTHHHIWPFAIVLIIFAASGQSSFATPKTGFSYDKFSHFMVFGLLATFIIRIPGLFRKGWKGVLITILLVSFYGAIDEFHQMFTKGRSVEFKDWLADTCGAILASILYLKWNWYRSTLELSLCNKKKRNLSES